MFGRFLASVMALVLMGGCGGQPVGSKVPRPEPTGVAIAAAAAATALTLANPGSAGRKREANEERELREVTGPKETVPAAVLDRAEDASEPGADQPPRCRPAAKAGGLALVPVPERDPRVPQLPECEPGTDEPARATEPPRATPGRDARRSRASAPPKP
jgi:hypothetical protein